MRKKLIALTCGALILAGGLGVYASLSPNDFENFNGNIPYPGTWAFNGSYPLGVGMATLFLSPSGSTTVLHVDGQVVTFNRQFDPTFSMYQSPTYSWDIPGTEGQKGTVTFSFGVNTPESVIGTINAIPAGTFGFTMEHVDMDLDYFDTPYNINQGIWDLELEVANDNCGEGGASAGLTGLSGRPAR